MPKLHEDIRAPGSNLKSEVYKYAALWLTVANLLLNLVALWQRSRIIAADSDTSQPSTADEITNSHAATEINRNQRPNLKLNSDETFTSEINSLMLDTSVLPIYISTSVYLLCLSKYLHKVFMTKVMLNERYNSHKLLLLAFSNSVAGCVQLTFLGFIALVYLTGSKNEDSDSSPKSNQEEEEEELQPNAVNSTSASIHLAQILTTTTLSSLLIVSIFFIKLIINDQKIHRYHNDYEYSRKIISTSDSSTGISENNDHRSEGAVEAGETPQRQSSQEFAVIIDWREPRAK